MRKIFILLLALLAVAQTITDKEIIQQGLNGFFEANKRRPSNELGDFCGHSGDLLKSRIEPTSVVDTLPLSPVSVCNSLTFGRCCRHWRFIPTTQGVYSTLVFFAKSKLMPASNLRQ